MLISAGIRRIVSHPCLENLARGLDSEQGRSRGVIHAAGRRARAGGRGQGR